MRNTERVQMVSWYLTQSAGPNAGKTISEISEATGISRSAVSRILAGSGFEKANAPTFPVGYYFDVDVAFKAIKRSTSNTKRERDMTKAILQSVREYAHGVDDAPLNSVGVFDQKVADKIEDLMGWCRNYLQAVSDNATELNNGEAALDEKNITDFRYAAAELQGILETINVFIDRQLTINVDSDPEWWANYVS